MFELISFTFLHKHFGKKLLFGLPFTPDVLYISVSGGYREPPWQQTQETFPPQTIT
jgi:hypothetical protein